MTLVLNAIEPGQRLSIMPRDFKGNAELALAVEIAEHVACARFDVRTELHDRHGNLLAWNEIPLTARFVQRAASRLGVDIGEKHARRLVRLLRRHCLEVVGRFRRTDHSLKPGFLLFAPRALHATGSAGLPAKSSVGKKRLSTLTPTQIQTLAKALRDSYPRESGP